MLMQMRVGLYFENQTHRVTQWCGSIMQLPAILRRKMKDEGISKLGVDHDSFNFNDAANNG
jgi:hypothetical protein